MVHGLRHVLTPGTPVYGALKLGALAGIVGLKVAVGRRDRRGGGERHGTAAGGHDPVAAGPDRRDPHPRSKKKRRRRRR